MVGDPVFVFVLLNARLLNNLQTHSQSFSQLTLRGRGIDVADASGPGLLILRPGTAYGE